MVIIFFVMRLKKFMMSLFSYVRLFGCLPTCLSVACSITFIHFYFTNLSFSFSCLVHLPIFFSSCISSPLTLLCFLSFTPLRSATFLPLWFTPVWSKKRESPDLNPSRSGCSSSFLVKMRYSSAIKVSSAWSSLTPSILFMHRYRCGHKLSEVRYARTKSGSEQQRTSINYPFHLFRSLHFFSILFYFSGVQQAHFSEHWFVRQRHRHRESQHRH